MTSSLIKLKHLLMNFILKEVTLFIEIILIHKRV